MKEQSKIHAMQPEEMKQLRHEMYFGIADLSAVTRIPYRTLQDYEAGKRKIPTHVAELLKHEAAKSKQIRRSVHKSIEKEIDRQHPHGIISEPEEIDHEGI